MVLILGCSAEVKKAESNPGATPASVAAVAPADSKAADAKPVAANKPLPPVTKAPALSKAAEQLVELAQAGVGDDVLLAYIERAEADYQLEVDQILYLHDLGLSAPVIAAMVRRDESSLLSKEGADSAKSPNQPVPESPPATTTPPAPVSLPSPEILETSSITLPAEVPQTYVTEPSTINYNYFYDNLSPYGNWVSDPDYGWCWQPTVAVVNSGWRPYCDGGRWLWTDCGWYWQSSYSWGGIPFHYGRWSYRPNGWIWVPGTTWGPSWVTWCNSGAYSGWAPLPPDCGYSAGVGLTFGGGSVGVGFSFGLGYNCWTFVPSGYVCNYSPWYYCVPPSRVPGMINNGTIVNNYVNGSGNNTVINVGPGVERIGAVSKTEIRKVAIQDANAAPGTVIRADRLDRSGRTLTVFRPTLPNQSPTPPEHILARQQEVRRNSETLVKSDVVKLARAESEQRAVTDNRPASSTVIDSRPTPVVARSPQLPVSAVGSSRNEVRAPSDTTRREPFRSPAPPNAVGSTYSAPGGRVIQPGSRNEVRSTPRTAPRSNQQSAPVVTPAPFGQPVPSTRSAPAPAPGMNSAQANSRPVVPPYRSESRNSQAVSPGTVIRPQSPVAPAFSEPRPVTRVYQAPPPAYNPPPRSYSPPPSANRPSVSAPPARSAPAPAPKPAYSSPPPPKSQPSSSSGNSRSGSGKNQP
jgi:hypothetical protein